MMQSSAAAGVDQSVSTSHRQVDPVETGVDDNAGADDHDHQRRDHRKVTLSVGVLGPSTQPDLTCHLNEELARHQRMSGKGPTLLEAPEHDGERSRQHAMTLQGEPPGSENSPGTGKPRRHLIDAGDESVDDCRRRSQYDHENYRLRREAEYHHRQREPENRWHGLHAGDE